MEISRYLWQKARKITGKSQLFINSYAKALEVCFVGLSCYTMVVETSAKTAVDVEFKGPQTNLSNMHDIRFCFLNTLKWKLEMDSCIHNFQINI